MTIKNAIHWLSTVLETPAIIILIIAVIIVLIELGSIIVEYLYGRLRHREDATDVLEQMKGRNADGIRAILEKSRFPKAFRNDFNKVLDNEDMPKSVAEVFAAQIITAEEHKKQMIMNVTDIIARIGPMFGLMATLIPLGPGLLALGQGDTKTLADSLLTAFDATVAGLAAAGVAFIISRIRRKWYESDLSDLNSVMEAILEETYLEPREEAQDAKK
ncbi:MAG: MotA/TolQ/ExbB proton channel family protein [Clostridiales Family XIII bacterium]|jgi:biopolymer transport protein ExbB/TolQ|nr:MotA/TolQ/ExbB proton channel family protein [Clostridiales Family XIII bacterium]